MRSRRSARTAAQGRLILRMIPSNPMLWCGYPEHPRAMTRRQTCSYVAIGTRAPRTTFRERHELWT